jgi:negative regulator of sigma E activity
MLATRARTDLAERVEALLAIEEDRYAQVIAEAAPDPEAAARLRTALENYEQARRAAR